MVEKTWSSRGPLRPAIIQNEVEQSENSINNLDQGWATLRVTRASIFSPFYQGARLLIHVHTPFTPFYSISFLLKEMKV